MSRLSPWLAVLSVALVASGTGCAGDCWPAGAPWPVECGEEAAAGDDDVAVPADDDAGDDDVRDDDTDDDPGDDDSAPTDDDATSDDDTHASSDDDSAPDDDAADDDSADDDTTGGEPAGELEVSPEALDFGSSSSNTDVLRLFEVRNAGSGTLWLHGAVFVPGVAAAGTVEVEGLPGSLAPGESAVVSATWDPGDMTGGLLGAGLCLDYLEGSALELASSDPEEGEVVLSVEGCCDSSGNDLCSASGLLSLYVCIASATSIAGILDCIF